jgi:hypothetical protein
MGVVVSFPFAPGDAVVAKNHHGEPFDAKVFSVIHRFGAPDFAVIVDAKGRTHHKFFRELEAAGK